MAEILSLSGRAGRADLRSLTRAFDRLTAALEAGAGAFARLAAARAEPGAAAGDAFAASAAAQLDSAHALLAANRQTADALARQVRAAGDLGAAQRRAAGEAGRVWSGFGRDMATTFSDLFQRITAGGARSFDDLWRDAARGLARRLGEVDLGGALAPALAPVLQSLAGLVPQMLRGDLKGAAGTLAGKLATGLAGHLGGRLLDPLTDRLFAAVGLGRAGGAGGGSLPALPPLPFGFIFDKLGLGGLFSGGAGALLSGILPMLAVLPVLSALGGRSSGPASIFTLGLEDGRIGPANVTVDNGGDPAVGQAMADAVAALVNPLLDLLGATLLPGAFRGAAGFERRQYRSSVLSNQLFLDRNDLADGLDLPGIASDVRSFGGNQAAATADFVVRSLLLAIREGTIKGLSRETAETMDAGLRRLALRINDKFEDLDLLAGNLRFLASFDRLKARFLDNAEAADRFAAALDRQRAGLRQEAEDRAGELFRPILDFVAGAVRVFGPLDPHKAPQALVAQMLGLEPANAGGNRIRDRFTALATVIGENGTSATGAGAGIEFLYAGGDPRALAAEIFGPGGFQPIRSAAGTGGGRAFAATGDAAAIDRLGLGAGFRIAGIDILHEEEGQSRHVVASTGRVLQTVSSGRLDTDQISVATDELVDALLEAGVTLSAVIDELGDESARRNLRDAFATARGMLDALFDDLTRNHAADPGATGLALVYEQQRAQIEALRPEIEALNAQLAAVGETVIDTDRKLAEATGTLRANLQREFVQSLDDILDPAAARAGEIEVVRDRMLREAELLGLSGDAGVRERIHAVFLLNLDKAGLVLDAFGEIVAAAGGAAAGIAAQMAAATAAIEGQIRAQEQQVAAQQALIADLEAGRRALALDRDLSILPPGEQLARARAEFDDLAARAREGDADAASRLVEAGRTMLELARNHHASSEAYAAAFAHVDATLAAGLDQARSQLSLALEELEVLKQIRDRLAPPETVLPPPGFDLGRNPGLRA